MSSSPADPPGLLLRGGRVVDPAGGLDGRADVALAGGRVVAVAPELCPSGREVLDVAGQLVLPGLVDLHVHLSPEHDGAAGHAMLARAGVTTALDLAGPIELVLQVAARHGAGLLIGCVESLQLGRHLPEHAALAEVDAAVARALADGALGIKLHYDSGLDPDVTAMAMSAGTAAGAWVAVHCGTTATGSDLHGLRETLALSGGRPLHVAHVNSYCRGETADPLEEAREAAALLRSAPGVFSESYLAAINGTWAGCRDGLPEVDRLGGWLARAGFEPTQAGLRNAIRSGFVRIALREDDDVALYDGDAGVAIWEAADTRTGACLAVNPPLPRIVLAGSCDASGRFDVDALATDGGGIPRNDTLARGLALVELGVLSLADLVRKACLTPSIALGLPGKGRLTVGADADVVVVDPVTRRVTATIAAGVPVMRNGRVLGSGSRVLTTEAGAATVAAAGCETNVIDLTASPLWRGEWAAARVSGPAATPTAAGS